MRKYLILITAASLVLGACRSNVDETAGKSISAAELSDRIEAGSPPVILDVRTREEFRDGHIPGAINIPYDELATRLAELSVAESQEVVVYCRSGRRARIAEATLQEGSFSNVRDLAGHWQAWPESGPPTE